MKIGILTFHRSINNGAVMQAYALSAALKKNFPSDSVEIIDYSMKSVEEAYSYTLRTYLANSGLKVRVNKMLTLLKDPQYLKRMKKRTAVFSSAVTQLPLSKKYILSEDSSEIFAYINSTYDVLIVGSDAVWNYVTRGYPNAYFPNHQVKIHKLSYAASCYGMNFLKCPDDIRSDICSVFNGFDFLGVRDKATEDMVKWSGAKIQPVHTCDPTAILEVDSLPVDKNVLENKLKERGFDFSKPTIGMMGNDDMFSMIKRMYGDRYQIVALYNYVNGADVNLYDITPFEWAYVFRYFKLTFTTFFHGTMLSLRNGVPLICISLRTEFSKTHTPKTLDLLQRCGLSDWYFETDYREQNIINIRAKADELMKKSYYNFIIEKIQTEAKSFDIFTAQLQTLMHKQSNEKCGGKND